MKVTNFLNGDAQLVPMEGAVGLSFVQERKAIKASGIRRNLIVDWFLTPNVGDLSAPEREHRHYSVSGGKPYSGFTRGSSLRNAGIRIHKPPHTKIPMYTGNKV
jgi:hypothetical protein